MCSIFKSLMFWNFNKKTQRLNDAVWHPAIDSWKTIFDIFLVFVAKLFKSLIWNRSCEPEANVENVVPCITCQFFRDSVKHKKSEACIVHSIELNSYIFSLCFTLGPATLHLAHHIKCKKKSIALWCITHRHDDRYPNNSDDICLTFLGILCAFYYSACLQ